MNAFIPAILRNSPVLSSAGEEWLKKWVKNFATHRPAGGVPAGENTEFAEKNKGEMVTDVMQGRERSKEIIHEVHDTCTVLPKEIGTMCVPWHRPTGQVWCNAGENAKKYKFFCGLHAREGRRGRRMARRKTERRA